MLAREKDVDEKRNVVATQRKPLREALGKIIWKEPLLVLVEVAFLRCLTSFSDSCAMTRWHHHYHLAELRV